jgi:hypothetical protein
VGILEFTTCAVQANHIGPTFFDFHLILARIKGALDPNNVANPTRLINMEKMKPKDDLLAESVASMPSPRPTKDKP